MTHRIIAFHDGAVSITDRCVASTTTHITRAVERRHEGDVCRNWRQAVVDRIIEAHTHPIYTHDNPYVVY